MAKAKKPQKSSSSTPVPDKIIEIDEGIFGTRLADRGEVPASQLLNLLKNFQKFEFLMDDDDEDGEGYLFDPDIDEEEVEADISSILATEDIPVNQRNLKRYLAYLKDNIKQPCYLTAIDEFEWEEKYSSGQGNKKQYEKLKKTNPSHLDMFKLVGFVDEVTLDKGIQVTVERPAMAVTSLFPWDFWKPLMKMTIHLILN